jgi:hypothetical protein
MSPAGNQVANIFTKQQLALPSTMPKACKAITLRQFILGEFSVNASCIHQGNSGHTTILLLSLMGRKKWQKVSL